VPPNGPPGASTCFDAQPAACNIFGVTGFDAGCPDPAIAVEIPVSMYWDQPNPWNNWDCIQHPEGQYMGAVTRGTVESACATARATLSGPPLVDFRVFAPYNTGSLYVYPHKALREYCVTHLSHMGPDLAECNPNYEQAFTKPGLTQWPVTGQPPKTIPHFATETTRANFTAYYGFWDNPGTGQIDDYITMNQHCAEDANTSSAPDIDGARIRFNCDCQEGALALIDAANPGWLGSNDTIYWFFAEP
jgi:hypothetical protein